MLDAPILEWSLSPQEIYKDQNAKQHVVLRVVWVFEKLQIIQSAVWQFSSLFI